MDELDHTIMCILLGASVGGLIGYFTTSTLTFATFLAVWLVNISLVIDLFIQKRGENEHPLFREEVRKNEEI